MGGQQIKDALTGGARLDHPILHHVQVFQRGINRENTADHLQESHGIGVAFGAEDDEIRQEQRHAAGAEKFHERSGNDLRAHDAHVVADVIADERVEIIHHDVFQIVGLDDAVTGEGFGHGLGQLGGPGLQFAGGAADFVPEDDDGNHAQRQHHDGDERQLGLLPQQQGQHSDELDGVADDDGGATVEDDQQGAGVVDDAGDELAGSVFIVETGGQVHQMREQLHAQVGHGAAGHPLQAITIQVGKHPAQQHDERNGGDQQRKRPRMRLDSGFHGVARGEKPVLKENGQSWHGQLRFACRIGRLKHGAVNEHDGGDQDAHHQAAENAGDHANE